MAAIKLVTSLRHAERQLREGAMHMGLGEQWWRLHPPVPFETALHLIETDPTLQAPI